MMFPFFIGFYGPSRLFHSFVAADPVKYVGHKGVKPLDYQQSKLSVLVSNQVECESALFLETVKNE